MSICIVLDRLNPKYNQKEASTTILKIRSQVRSASFFNLLFLLIYCLVISLSHCLLCLGFVVSSVCLSRVCYKTKEIEREREREREGKREKECENLTEKILCYPASLRSHCL